MKASDLNKYFNDTLSLDSFFQSLQSEMLEYISNRSKHGSSRPLYFDEDQDIYLSKIYLSKILSEISLENYYLNTLSYILDCLTLGEKVHYTDTISSELLFDLADEETCMSLNSEEISRLLNLLK